MTNRYFRPILSSNIGNSESPFRNIQSLQNQQGSYLRTEEAAISPFKEDLLPMRTFLTNMELLGLYDHEIPAERLSPFKGPEETRFKRKVYQIKLNILKKAKARFVASLPEKKLDWIKDNRHPTGKPLKLRVEAAESCSRLLKSAREYFLSRSLNVKFYAQSGYRSAEEQLKKWNSNFPKYYSQTENKRKSMEGGPHGDKAAIFLIRFIGGRLAMPGFSLHNSGLAVDFITVENGKKWGIMTTKTGVYENAWRKTYFFDWLSKNASIFKFFQNNKINEPWHWEYRPGTSSGMEVPVAFPVKPLMGETLYVNIDLTTKNYPDKHQLTGIYIPPSFIRGLKAKANVIIYLHGHKTGYPKVTATIREYWESKNFPLFAFREELSESGKNAILIAPTLGPRSQAGKLINVSAGGGLHWYLGQILGILRKRGIANEINEVVLACHSGGGSPMLRLAIENNKSRIIEYWGFDCVYGDYQQEGWLKWARKNPYKLLYIYYYSSTQKRSEELRKRARELMFRNISVAGLEILYAKKNEHVKTQLKKSYKDPHYWVPITYWRDRLSHLSWG